MRFSTIYLQYLSSPRHHRSLTRARQQCAPRRRSLRHSRFSTETPTIARATELTTRINVVALQWHCGFATSLPGIAPCDARCDTPVPPPHKSAGMARGPCTRGDLQLGAVRPNGTLAHIRPLRLVPELQAPRHASQSFSRTLAAVPPTWLENATGEVRGFCQACQNIAFLTSSLFPCCKL